MLIFAIDDEPKPLNRLHKAIREAEPEAEIRDFLLGAEAVSAIETDGLCPDIVFSDIQMPGLTGLELAVRLKELSPDTKIVFVTGYDDYALDAYRLHVGGYIMKPVEARLIREELRHHFPDRVSRQDRLYVQCFGAFEVFWKGQPLHFGRRQTKEVFAFLVDRKGASCTAEEIIAALWENGEDLKRAKQRLRNCVNDIKSTLNAVGAGDLLIRRGSLLALRPELLECDYYRMLEGDMAAVNAFRGLYMEQYSWAELTKGSLFFHKVGQ